MESPPPATQPISGEVACHRPGGRGAWGQARLDRGRGWQGAPVFSTPSSLPQSWPPAHKLCSNYKWFDNFRPGPAIKNKEEDKQHCLVTMPLIGGVNFNGPSWCLRGGNSRIGALAAIPCDAHPALLPICLPIRRDPLRAGAVPLFIRFYPWCLAHSKHLIDICETNKGLSGPLCRRQDQELLRVFFFFLLFSLSPEEFSLLGSHL